MQSRLYEKQQQTKTEISDDFFSSSWQHLRKSGKAIQNFPRKVYKSFVLQHDLKMVLHSLCTEYWALKYQRLFIAHLFQRNVTKTGGGGGETSLRGYGLAILHFGKHMHPVPTLNHETYQTNKKIMGCEFPSLGFF